MSRNAKRWMAVFDNHGDRQDNGAVEAALAFAKHWKPEVRVHGGDCFDFRCLRKKASDFERRASLSDDMEAGCSFLRRYKPTHFLRGNHDERLWDLLDEDDGKLAGYAKHLIEEIKDALGNAQVFPYDKRRGVLRLPGTHLKILHGFHSGVTAARQAGLVYGSCIMGHVHTVDQYSLPGLERRVARAAGALCLLDQDYNRAQAQTLRQSHGWVYGLILPSGEYTVWQAEQVGGKWHVPTNIVTL